jgi:hypothetical protein
MRNIPIHWLCNVHAPCMHRYGPIPRFVLQMATSERRQRWYEELEEALIRVDPTAALRAVGSSAASLYVSHLLVHMRADKDYSMAPYTLASHWVSKQVAAR